MSDPNNSSPNHDSRSASDPHDQPNSLPRTPHDPNAPDQTLKKENSAARRQIREEREWKKQIKHYFRTLRKLAAHKLSQMNEAWLVIALKLLNFGPKQKNSESLSSRLPSGSTQRKDGGNSKIMTIVNRPPKPHSFLVLILSGRICPSKQQQIYFDLELVSKTSRIVYKKLNLRKWQEIHKEIERTKAQTQNLVKILIDKSALLPHIYNNIELLNLVSEFSGLEMTPLKRDPEETHRDAYELQNYREAELIHQVIERFQFIRGSLIRLLKKDSHAALTLDETLALTLAHNVLNIFPLTTSRSLSAQMKHTCTPIVKYISRENSRHIKRCSSVALNQDHFPVHLENAQNCWRCKKKRGYVCCSTCTRNEGKNISLCLNCYASHHGEITRGVVPHAERETAAIFDQWCALNQHVEAMIPEMNAFLSEADATPEEQAMVKTEEGV